mmetsp:Transcript_10304/g.27470  ORF Transcript_10304/g.27470 Transcript_10304/m.27470 type:complete len:279 (+) Transcript_10304:243-1079(+)
MRSVLASRASSVCDCRSPRTLRPYAYMLRERHVLPSSAPSVHEPETTWSLTSDPKSPHGLEKSRDCASSAEMVVFALEFDASRFSLSRKSCSECFRIKFISSGSSSALAARRNMSSSRNTTCSKQSRKIPDIDTSTSILGRPSASNGISSKDAVRPVASHTSLAPTRPSTSPTLSPRVLILSRTHSGTATVSGYAPSLSARCFSMSASASAAPLAYARALGMRYGSSEKMFRPVGNTSFPSRSTSPPSAGGTYPPRSATKRLRNSSSLCISRSRASIM